jgi:hypothetical protein
MVNTRGHLRTKEVAPGCFYKERAGNPTLQDWDDSERRTWKGFKEKHFFVIGRDLNLMVIYGDA